MGTNINNNININFGTQITGGNTSSSLNSIVPNQLPSEVTSPDSDLGSFLQGFESGFTTGLMSGLADGLSGALAGQTTPCEPPTPSDSAQPSGTLQVDKSTGEITTPGGYKIDQVGQFDWKVTGPDGKSSEIWGDPHVKEEGADGTQTGGFDFKKPATFVLGDGTKIDVATTPYSQNPNVTVTQGLTITNGNDRVQVTDIDKGKGVVGDVTHDGFQHVNDAAGNQVFVEGQNAAQWTSGGQEILGDATAGTPDNFKLGDAVPPLISGQTGSTQPTTGNQDWVGQIMGDLANLLKDVMPLMSSTPPFSLPPYTGGVDAGAPGATSTPSTPSTTGNGGTSSTGGTHYHRHHHEQGLGQALQDLGNMFKVLGDIASLTQQLNQRTINI
jgi:hypothetical protein